MSATVDSNSKSAIQTFFRNVFIGVSQKIATFSDPGFKITNLVLIPPKLYFCQIILRRNQSRRGQLKSWTKTKLPFFGEILVVINNFLWSENAMCIQILHVQCQRPAGISIAEVKSDEMMNIK